MKTNLVLLPLLCLLACAHSPRAGEKPATDTLPTKKVSSGKPGSTYQDSLFIEGRCAVFYAPDSLQLMNIRAQMDKGVFESTMHEYGNQLRVSHIELKEQWKDVKVVEARNVRWLCFRKKNGGTHVIDLDQQGDTYGLFAFDGENDPAPIDMMNVGTRLYYYFHK